MGKIRLNDLNKALRQCGIGLDYDEIKGTPCFEVSMPMPGIMVMMAFMG